MQVITPFGVVTYSKEEGAGMEKQLVKRAQQGDKDAFMKLMDAQMQTMYKLAWSYLKNAEDVADMIQDTILTCYEKIPTLREEQYFKTWMMKILINHCKNLLKKKNRTVHMEILPEGTFVEQEYNKREWNQMLDQLDEKYRTILLLYYLENFNTREISQILDMNENTVRVRLKRGRDKLIRECRFAADF